MAEIDAGLSGFRFQPETVQGGSLGVSGAGPRLGVSGGNSRFGVERIADTTDLGAGSNLPAFLEQAFAPKIAAVKQAKMREGFTAAVLGKTQAEISAEQPWYSKVFGPTPFELGAETFVTQKASSDISSYVANEMPRLRTLSSEDVASEVWARMDSQIDKDNPYTAMQLTKSMMERMPALLDLHAKQRYSWEQEEMREAQVATGLSALGEFESMRKSYATLGSDEAFQVETGYSRADIQRNLLSTLATSEYQDPDSVKQYWNDLIIQAADKGMFSGIAVLVESGLEGAVGTEDAARLKALVERKWADYKETALLNDPEMLRRKVEINVAATQGVGSMKAWEAMDAFDKEFQAKHGYLPYFNARDKETAGTTAANAWITDEERALNEIEAEQKRIAREAAADAKAEDAAAAKEALRNKTISHGVTMVLSGQKAALDASTAFSDEDNELVTTAAYDRVAQAQPQLAGQILTWTHANNGKPSSALTRRFQQNVDVATGGPINDAFRQSYALWETLYSGTAARVNPATRELEGTDTTAGKATALAYFGVERNARMLTYHRLRKTGMPDQHAYAMSWGESPEARPTVQGATAQETKQLRTAFKETIDDYSPTLWSRVVGGGKLTASGRVKLSQYVGGALDQLGDIKDVDLRLKYAVKYARDNGVEINGKFLWKNGNNQQPTATYLGRNPTVAADIVDRTITQKILANTGIRVADDTQVSVIRALDRSGEPVLQATVLGKDATWRSVEITGADMKRTLREDVTRPKTRGGIGAATMLRPGRD